MRTPRLRHTCACLLSLFVLSAPTLLAQSTGGRFIGQVSDPSGAVLAWRTGHAGQRSERRKPHYDDEREWRFLFSRSPCGYLSFRV